MATHLFNAMPPLHHRQPGLVGALLASSARLGLIADGVHVDPLVVDLVVRRAGTERVVLVSDALAAAGASAGASVLGDQTVRSDGRVVRRLDGTLAGSAAPARVPAQRPRLAAGSAACHTDRYGHRARRPALLGANRKGRVAVGCDADLVVLDSDFKVRMTVLRGELMVAPPLVEQRMTERRTERLVAEICEQPRVIGALLVQQWAAVRAVASTVARREPSAIVLVARGSSDNAAVYGRYLFEVCNRRLTSLAAPSGLTLYGRGPRLDQTVVIGISQSGQGEDVDAYVARGARAGRGDRRHRQRRAVAARADRRIRYSAACAGPELSVPATKTVTPQMTLLAMLSVALERSRRRADRTASIRRWR